MIFNKCFVILIIFLFGSSFSKDHNFVDITQIRQEAKADEIKFKNNYLNKKLYLVGRAFSGFQPKEEFMICALTGLDGKLEKPYLSWHLPKNLAEKYKDIKHNDTLYLIAKIYMYVDDIIYLRNVKIIKHKKNIFKIKKLEDGTILVSAPNFVKGGSLKGPRSKAAIMGEILGKYAELRVVYNNELKLNENIEGNVTVEFEIMPSGKVGNCEITNSSINHTEIEKNVIRVVKGINFDKNEESNKNTVVNYKFVFRNHEKY